MPAAFAPTTRTRVLSDMPHSANVVFDVFRSLARGRSTLDLSIRDLAEMCRLSERQTRRALARLEAERLLTWQRGGCGQGTR